MIPRNRSATHPGTILKKEFLDPLDLTPEALAEHIGLPAERIEDIIEGNAGMTTEVAWLLSEAFNTSPEFWLNLQSTHELSTHRPTRHVEPLISAAG